MIDVTATLLLFGRDRLRHRVDIDDLGARLTCSTNNDVIRDATAVTTSTIPGHRRWTLIRPESVWGGNDAADIAGSRATSVVRILDRGRARRTPRQAIIGLGGRLPWNWGGRGRLPALAPGLTRRAIERRCRRPTWTHARPR